MRSKSGGQLPLTGHTVFRMLAKQAEKPGNDVLRARMAEGWSIARMATLSTEDILARLDALGVSISQQRMAELVKGRLDAWGLGESWCDAAGIVDRVHDEDFVCLAACELWKRWLPEPPSTEMIDDWMQEGYALVERSPVQALEVWWRVWCALRPRFHDGARDPMYADSVFDGFQSLFNWIQDVERTVEAVARKDSHWAAVGRRFCNEVLDQFTEAEENLDTNFRRTLARLYFMQGELAAGEQVLLENIRRWPDSFWGLVGAGDAYAHFFRGDPGPAQDIEKARSFYSRALAHARTSEDKKTVSDRLAELQKRTTQG